jgi:hypothetical protein
MALGTFLTSIGGRYIPIVLFTLFEIYMKYVLKMEVYDDGYGTQKNYWDFVGSR